MNKIRSVILLMFAVSVFLVTSASFPGNTGNGEVRAYHNDEILGADPSAPVITTDSLPDGIFGSVYSQTLGATGDPTITWSIESGNLPGGLTLSSSGTISGTPAGSGTFNFTVKATNGAGEDTRGLSITITKAPEITSADNTGVFRVTGGMFQVVATGTAPITYNLAGAPSGVSIGTSSGLMTISGTVPAGTHTFTVRASNGTLPNAEQSFTLTVTEPTYGISLAPSGDKDFGSATVGYGTQISHSITVNNTGNQMTGTLTAGLSGTDAGSFTLDRTPMESIAVSGSTFFTVVPVNGLPAGEYTATVTVSGGNGIYGSFDVFFTVTVTDVVKPTVVSVTPSGTGAASSGDLVITFSEPMYIIPGTVKLNTMILSSGSGTWSLDNTVYTIPYNGLSEGYYIVNITGFNDAAMNRMVDDSSNGFSTGAAPMMYTVTVVNGMAGSTSYAAGASVAITANAAPAGKMFDKWTSASGATFANTNSATTTFTMPGNTVTVTATYKDASASSGSGGNKILGLDPIILAAVIAAAAIGIAAAAWFFFLKKP